MTVNKVENLTLVIEDTNWYFVRRYSANFEKATPE